MQRDLEKYKALGCDMRFRIMHILINHKEGLYVGEIVTILNEKQYNISRHLSILKNANLINEQKIGKFVLYRANFCEDNIYIFESIKFTGTNNKKFKNDLENLEEIRKLRDKNNNVN